MKHNSRTAQINVKDQIKKGVKQIDASSHIGEITSKVLVQQVFNATHPFDTLEIMLATFKRKNTPTISLHLIDFLPSHLTRYTLLSLPSVFPVV